VRAFELTEHRLSRIENPAAGRLAPTGRLSSPPVTAPHDRPLREQDLDPDPLSLFARWFDEALGAGAYEPDAVALATATPEGEPSVRMVLSKGFDARGFAFFTNYASRKGLELEANPRAALLFHWPELGRQVRIEGAVERVPRAESETYAHSRSRPSQLSALASPQSRPVPSREWLERRVDELDREHGGRALPVSDGWGGYRLTPRAWEFWQHRPNRLHDRFRYLPADGGGWRVERLAP
jgi:pyridoxamine 5'-phosphate oxidase